MEGRLPTTGEEYLRMVREQAKAYPTVMVAQATQEVRLAKNTSAKYRTDWQTLQPAPAGCAPSKAWQDDFLVQYEQDRRHLAACRGRSVDRENTGESVSRANKDKQRVSGTSARDPHRGDEVSNDYKEKIARVNDEEQVGSANIPNESTSRSTHRDSMKLPRANDEQGWYRLLYGSAIEGHIDPGSQPSPALLMRLHQGQVIQLLHYHVNWLASDNLSDREGQWLYALFLRLDPLVESDEVSILRSVAKRCALIRSHMTGESGSKLASVNMVITLVARVYGQADMLP